MIRKIDDKYLIDISVPIGIEGLTPDEACKAIKEATHDMIEPHFEIYVQNDDYDSSYPVINIVGRREATSDEIARYKKAQKQREQFNRAQQEQLFKKLKKERPDLFE